MAERRVAVVTGAARGIGWAIAEALSSAFDIVLVDRLDEVEQRASELRGRGLKASAFLADLTKSDELPALAQQILASAGRCDVLVNNAGVHFKKGDGSRFTLEDVTLDNWNQTIAINLTAPLLLTRAFIPDMVSRKWGRIINVSSRGGRTYTPSSPSYIVTKTGMVGLTRIIAGDYSKMGITCNCVAPGRVRTLMTDASSAEAQEAGLGELLVGQLGDPREIGATAAFLASDDAGFITGAVIDVNGGSFMG